MSRAPLSHKDAEAHRRKLALGVNANQDQLIEQQEEINDHENRIDILEALFALGSED